MNKETNMNAAVALRTKDCFSVQYALLSCLCFLLSYPMLIIIFNILFLTSFARYEKSRILSILLIVQRKKSQKLPKSYSFE